MLGRPRPKGQPSSRTGENSPYGMIGGIEETSASFEARSAPRSYPTCWLCRFMALSWPNLPCALKTAIDIGKRTLGGPASLPRHRGRSKGLLQGLLRVRATILASEHARHEQRRQNRPGRDACQLLAARARGRMR